MPVHHFKVELSNYSDYEDTFELFMTEGVKNWSFFPGNISNSIALAHDVLEHQPGRYKTLEDEVRAFGGMWACRGTGGWFKQHNNWSDTQTAEKLGHEIGRFLAREVEMINFKSAYKTPHKMLRIMAETAYETYMEHGPGAYQEHVVMDSLDIYMYLELGFGSAKRRHVDGILGCGIFEDIQYQAEKCIFENGPFFPGDRWRLERTDARVNLIRTGWGKF